MKLIMTLLVRDEEDIIKENIDFHLSQGVDFIIATDNLSEDSTPEILKKYEEKGVLHYIFENSDDYSQHEWVTRMARIAYTKYHADWVINNDADEFWWPKEEKTLKKFFQVLPKKYDIVKVNRHNFIPVEGSDKFYQRMTFREINSLNEAGKPLIPKAAHQGSSNIEVFQGNHNVAGFKKPTYYFGGIDILHFPIRTYDQFLNKIKKGGAAYERNNKLDKHIGNTWRTLYKEFKKNYSLKNFFMQRYYDQEKIQEGLDNGKIVDDYRLKNYLNNLYGDQINN